ncbi:glycosyltransferase [Pedobacter sp. HMF7647]|uniref:Glycosyltransferase n=1 Tax=Hufsiella arboris TaxID=2695275 RepID=A0A7K1YDZ5_9SPHI|nr:glycosyltransferase family 4 protein [Hufsiella arboris]MXV52815.1 glycosyltransferase [Hufsiella arboris]
MKKLAIVTTHPIQYYAPVFRFLAKKANIKVFYTWGEEGNKPKHDPDFGKTIAWDLPLLDGYAYEFLKNTAADPGSHHFKGIQNPEIIHRLKDFKPDAILVYGWSYASHLKVMRYFKGKVPVWFRGDSTLLDESSGLKNIAKSLLLRWVYQHVDKVFYVGTANKAYYLKYGLKESRLVFAPHAIDNNRFSKNRNDEARKLRENLDIKEEDILILFAGKLEPKKDPELLMEAFIKLGNGSLSPLSMTFTSRLMGATKEIEVGASTPLSETRSIRLLFVGNGILEESLKQKAANSPQKSTIHFMDFQNQTQMPVVYQACDLFCLPSKGPGETWGLAVNEAMAAGKAVLVSDKVGCSVDLVKNAENGYIFRNGDLADLIDKLALLSNKKVLQQMGRVSNKIIGDWSFKKQVQVFVKELNEQG